MNSDAKLRLTFWQFRPLPVYRLYSNFNLSPSDSSRLMIAASPGCVFFANGSRDQHTTDLEHDLPPPVSTATCPCSASPSLAKSAGDACALFKPPPPPPGWLPGTAERKRREKFKKKK